MSLLVGLDIIAIKELTMAIAKKIKEEDLKALAAILKEESDERRALRAAEWTKKEEKE